MTSKSKREEQEQIRQAFYDGLDGNREFYNAYQNNVLVHYFFNAALITGERYERMLEKLVVALIDQNNKHFEMVKHAEDITLPSPLFERNATGQKGI